jgi:hypothetical protein
MTMQEQKQDLAETENGQPQVQVLSREATRAVELSRAETDALLYALDDSDRLFMHHRGQELLALWQRLHLACCYLDGEQGFHGTPEERSLHLTFRDAVNLWLTFDDDYERAQPKRFRAPLRAVLERCRLSTMPTERAPVLAPDRSRSTPDAVAVPVARLTGDA